MWGGRGGPSLSSSPLPTSHPLSYLSRTSSLPLLFSPLPLLLPSLLPPQSFPCLLSPSFPSSPLSPNLLPSPQVRRPAAWSYGGGGCGGEGGVHGALRGARHVQKTHPPQALHDMKLASTWFKQHHDEGLGTLCTALRPRLRGLLDPLTGKSTAMWYELTEAEYTKNEDRYLVYSCRGTNNFFCFGPLITRCSVSHLVLPVQNTQSNKVDAPLRLQALT